MSNITSLALGRYVNAYILIILHIILNRKTLLKNIDSYIVKPPKF